MALGNGLKKSISCNQEVAPASLNNGVESGKQAVGPTFRRTWGCKCLLALLIILILILIVTGTTLAWYFLEYNVWVLEPRVQQEYTAYLSILNRNFSAELSSHKSPPFMKEAKGVQNMVEKIMKGSSLSRYFNYTTVFAFSEGSVVAHFWIVMSVPSSHVGRVTLSKVTTSLEEGLRGYGWSEEEKTVSLDGYLLHLPSLSVSETDSKVIELLKASFGVSTANHQSSSFPKSWEDV